ncbi:MAG TPA: hypothetical protein VKV57_03755 [bacterium]|nr:hypothetical protein [bacterium]
MLRRTTQTPAFYLILFLLMGLYIWIPNNFMGFSSDIIGEAYEAYHGAMNLERFGWRWAGLQDEATNPNPAAHPYLYIHHGNVGIYFSYFLSEIGIRSIEAQNALSVIPFLIGLYVAYLFWTHLSGSRLGGVLFLIFGCLDSSALFVWGFNIHRAFSYPAFFGCLFVHFKLVRARNKLIPSVALLIIALILLFVDYIFFFYTFALVCLMQLTAYSELIARRSRLRLFICVASAFIMAFALRQAQVLAGVGLRTWATDFLFQALNRLHLERLFRGNWSQDTTQFYSSHHILNPGFAPPVGWWERMHSYSADLGYAFIHRIVAGEGAVKYGSVMIGVMLLGMVILCGALVSLGGLNARLRRVIRGIVASFIVVYLGGFFLSLALSVAISWTRRGFAPTWLAIPVSTLSLAIVGLVLFEISLSWARLFGDIPILTTSEARVFGFVLSSAGACIIMYAVFPRYFMQWFPTFNLDTICVVGWTVAAFVFALRKHLESRPWPAWMLLVLVILKVLAITPDVVARPVGLGDYAQILRALEGHSVVSDFTPASVASYTRAFSASLPLDIIHPTLNSRDLDLSEYKLFGERDAANPIYRHPEYLLLFRAVTPPAVVEELINGGLPVAGEGRSFVLFDLRNRR